MTDPFPPMQPPTRPRVDLGALNSAWTLLMQQMSAWMVVSLVMLTVMIAFSAAAMTPLMIMAGSIEVWQREMQRPGSLIWVLYYVLAIPGSVWVTTGGMNVALKQIRGGYVKPDDLFALKGAFGRVLVYSAILSFAVMLVAIVNQWLAIFCSFALNGRLFLTVPIIVDRGIGWNEAVRMSWDATRGQWLRSLGFLIVCGLAAASGLLLCLVGFIVTLPLVYLPQVVIYRRFFPDQPASSISPDLTDADFRTF